MPADLIPIALIVLSVIGAALVTVAVGIYRRIGELTSVLIELREITAGHQTELVKTKEGIGKVHSDLGRLVTNATVTSELVRSVSRLPTR